MKLQQYNCRKSKVKEQRLNKFRTVVSDVSSFMVSLVNSENLTTVKKVYVIVFT